MADQLTHDQVSELLSEHVRGRLDPARSAAVESHLAGCDDCTTEVLVARMLAEPVEGLSELERRKLHRAVQEETAPERSADSRWAGVSRFLGVAALLVLLAAGIYLGANSDLLGGDDEATMSGAGGADSAEEESGALEDRAAKDGGGTAGSGAGAGSSFYVGDVGEVRQLDLRRLGRTQFTARTSMALPQQAGEADTGSGGNGGTDGGKEKDRNEAAEELAANVGLTPQIQSCIDAIVGEVSGATPTYAADATYNGEGAFVVGFVYPASGEGKPDRYSIYVWAGDGCDVTLDFISGSLRR